MILRMSPGEVVFGAVPGKTLSCVPDRVVCLHHTCPQLKLIIGVPGKVVYLHYTTVYCACLSVVLVPFHCC